MQRLLTLLLLTALTSLTANAQLDSVARKEVSQAAFRLTKATVEFVATDKTTFGSRTETTCETCTDYTSLVQFAKTNKLMKADELINDARRKVDSLLTGGATADQLLNSVRQYLHDRVTRGGGRERRMALPSYETYTTQLIKILDDAGVDVSADEVRAAALPADTTETGEPIVTAPSGTTTEAGIFSYGGLALLLSLLSLAGIVYLWNLRNKQPASAPLSSSQLSELSRRVSALETERKSLLDRVARLEKGASVPPQRPAPTPTPEPRRPEPAPRTNPAPAASTPEPTRPAQPDSPVAPLLTPAPRPTTPAPVPAPVPQSSQNQVVPAVPANQPRRREIVLYGRTADLGDGFSVASLLETPDRDTVFQIEVRTDSQAVYRVTEEPGAQQLALSDPYSYLADACEYGAKPTPNARIRTNQPGQLALQGDKWKIVEKAKIGFY